MASILDQHWNELGEKFGRRPVWLPGTPMHLGDIGILRTRGWEKVSDLQSVGINFLREPVGAKTAYSYSSSRGVEVTVRSGVDADAPMKGVAKGNAALGIKFSRAAAFVLMADDAEVERIASLEVVDRAVLAAFQSNAWRPEWIYISEVVMGAPSLTVISATADGEAVVDLAGGLRPGATELGRVGAKVGFGYKKDLAASFVTADKSAVMWRGHYVRNPLLGGPTIKERGGRGEHSSRDEAPIEPVVSIEEVEYLSDVLRDEKS